MSPEFRDFGTLCEADHTGGRPQPVPRYGSAGGRRVRPHASFWAFAGLVLAVAVLGAGLYVSYRAMRAVDARCAEAGCEVGPR